jgi:tetratricopeptide (TPR) repeat protein/predicted Ser/Thr protein kinase
MPYETDGLVGKLALQKGLISSADLKECLAEQAALQAAGQKRPVGVIMVSRGLMKDEDLLDLLEEQRRYLAERANYTQVRKEDFLFGQILLKQGVATSEDINRALRTQAEAAERGEMPVPRLGQILMEMGVSDEKAVQQTLKIQYKTLYECPGCTLKYNLVEADPAKQYRCKKCGVLLSAKPPGGGVKADESAYGLKLEVADDVPPEVAEAEKDEKNRFDKYILLGQIGRGGMGTVYKAYQKELKRTVAVKVLRGGDEETLRRFAREAQTAASLKHPNIVSVYEIGTWHGVPYLTMEFIDGQPLDDLGRIPLKKACQLLRDVAMAIHFAHQKGVIHRDLKPQNILIDKDGRAYVTDFGLAREFAEGKNLTLDGIVVGTPAYMSPEQARGDRNLDGRSDVSSLGCVLYELLTDLQPYSGRSPLDIAIAVLKEDPVPPRKIDDTIPPDLEAVCLKALEKERERRYPTARAFAEDLQRFLEGEPVRATAPSAVRVALKRFGRNKAAAWIMASAAALLAVTLGVLSSVARRSQTKDTIIEGRELEQKGELEKALGIYSRDPATAGEAVRVSAEIRRRDERALARRRALAILGGAGVEVPSARRVEVATEALATFPELEDAWALRAHARQDLGEDMAAYADLGRAAELAPAPLPHLMGRAEIARRLGHDEDEIADLTRAIAISPHGLELILARAAASTRFARKLALADDPETGRQAAFRILEAEEDLARLGRHPRLEGAKRDLSELVLELGRAGSHGRLAVSFAGAALELSHSGRAAAAQRAAGHALEIDPGCAPAFAARGLALQQSGRFGEAREEARRALELEPTLPEAFLVRGLSRVGQAITVIESALPKDLSLPASGDEPAWVSDFADGCVDLEDFLEHGPKRPDLRPLEERASSLPRSVPARSAADGTDVRRHLSAKLVERAARLRGRGILDSAAGLLGHALALDDRNVPALLERAECRYRAEDWADAAIDWERAEALDPSLRPALDVRVRDARQRAGD